MFLPSFLLKNEKSTTPVSKSSTPTSRSDAPTPSSTITPVLRAAPAKLSGVETLGKHHAAFKDRTYESVHTESDSHFSLIQPDPIILMVNNIVLLLLLL